MAKRQSLAQAVAAQTATDETEVTTEQAQPAKRYVPPSRVGKRQVTIHVEADDYRRLKMLAVSEDSSLQSLGVEALNLLMTSRGEPELNTKILG